jgi:phosphoglucosamine mutase
MPRLFGTDGVRGLANRELTADLALGLAQAAAAVLTRGRHADELRAAGRRPVAVVARDPRVSGEFLTAAVSAGLASSGVDVLDAGVIPTPATAFLIDSIRADFGVMISASHNPAPDNGIKFFSYGGTKLPDEVEDRIESYLGRQKLAPTGDGVGRVRRFADAEDRYVVHLLATLPNRLEGLKVVLDCAHGAAAGVSPETFRDAGAEVVVIGADPDGMNINDGVGSTHLEPLQRAVREHGADIGIAHDGDADRCLAVDADGNVVDGDRIMAILAVSMQERGTLTDDTLVVTVMSNLGLRRAMAERGIRVVETKVGDRYVLEAMRAGGYNLGGEQSGHMILLDHATTGDGCIAALQVLAALVRSGKRASDLLHVFDPVPQLLKNVVYSGGDPLADPKVQAAIADGEAELSGRGRLVIRKSGTEPLIRVMAEGDDPALVEQLVDRVCEAVAAA